MQVAVGFREETWNAPARAGFGPSLGRFARVDELRRQHRAWERGGYDGHNRHGGLTTMDRLRERRRRRRLRLAMSVWLRTYR